MTRIKKICVTVAAVAAAAVATGAQTSRLSPWFSGNHQTPKSLSVEYRAPVAQNPQDQSNTTAHDPKARFIRRERYKTLPQLLSPSDEAIEVVKVGELPSSWHEIDDPASELETETRITDAALVVSVLDIRGRLKEEQEWLESEVDVEIESVLKDSTNRLLAPGMRMTFTIDGGELKVGRQRILARASWQVLPKRGHRYVYFFIDYKGVLFPDNALHTFEVRDGQLARLSWAKAGGLDRGVSADWAASEIRANSHLPKEGISH